MKIVKFKNGKYAIRKLTLLGYRYEHQGIWWDRESGLFRRGDCYFDAVDGANERFDQLADRGAPVRQRTAAHLKLEIGADNTGESK